MADEVEQVALGLLLQLHDDNLDQLSQILDRVSSLKDVLQGIKDLAAGLVIAPKVDTTAIDGITKIRDAVQSIHDRTVSPAQPTLLQVPGTGDQQTQLFMAPSSWSIHYTYDCSGFSDFGGGVFSVSVMNSDGSYSLANQPFDANPHGNQSSGRQFYHSGGTFYLSVISDCDWTLSATVP